jgi:hypothetical protein
MRENEKRGKTKKENPLLPTKKKVNNSQKFPMAYNSIRSQGLSKNQ